MKSAFVWTCDNCGTDHFVHAAIDDIPEEEKLKALQTSSRQIDDASNWDILLLPKFVKCPDCGIEYQATVKETLSD